MRRQVNRVVVVFALAAVLPAVVLGEKLRPGSGRRIAVASARVIARVCAVRFDVRGGERLQAVRCVVVSNHRSPLDIVALLVADADLRFVAASELFRVPLLGPAMRALDTEPINRRNAAAARREVDALVRPGMERSLVVFAEGGIAPAGVLLPFKSGAFVLAIAAGVPVVPVALRGTATALPPGARLAVEPARVTVEVLAPISTAGMAIADRKRLRDTTRDAIAGALVAA